MTDTSPAALLRQPAQTAERKEYGVFVEGVEYVPAYRLSRMKEEHAGRAIALLAAQARCATLEAEIERLKGLMPDISPHQHDRLTATGKNAIRSVIAWLHERAKSMNDPHAQAILNVAASDLGRALRCGAIGPQEPRP
jgi:hypothetical protein